MENVLIVSSTAKGIEYFSALCSSLGSKMCLHSTTCARAREMLALQAFDCVVINSPLKDESGLRLARAVAQKQDAQVLLAIHTDHYEEAFETLQNDGVFLLPKPVAKEVAIHTFHMAMVANRRFRSLKAENQKLRQQINDIRIIDRAKHFLIANLCMSEKEAHRYIEKQAMDRRTSKRDIAQSIVQTYEY